MALLFGRQWSLQVGNLDLSDLDIGFKVERATARAPNVGEIRVWNLAPNTRAQVEGGGTCILHAGYEDPPLIFRGDSRRVWTETDGPTDWVTVIQARDGGRAYSEAQFSRSYNPGTQVIRVVRDVISDMEIGVGNLGEFEGAYQLRNGATTFPDGYVAHGRCSRILNTLVRAAGLRWSVQGNALQLQQGGQPLQTRAVVLSADSGLLGSPTWDERGRQTSGRRGVLTCQSLIQAGLEPGRRVRVESRLVTGDFEARKITYQGETFGNDWTATLELRPLAA